MKNFLKEGDIIDKFYTVPEHRISKMKLEKSKAQEKESDLIGDMLRCFE